MEPLLQPQRVVITALKREIDQLTAQNALLQEKLEELTTLMNETIAAADAANTAAENANNHPSRTDNPHQVTKAQVGLSNADNTSDINKPVSTAQAAAISTAIANIVNSAPASLDTLKELADAMGNDPNFAATIINALAGKASTTHTHTKSNITDFAHTHAFADLSGAAAANHTHNYNDLSGKPTIPSVGSGTITIQQGGTTKGTFNTNQNYDATINLDATESGGETTIKPIFAIDGSSVNTNGATGTISINENKNQLTLNAPKIRSGATIVIYNRYANAVGYGAETGSLIQSNLFETLPSWITMNSRDEYSRTYAFYIAENTTGSSRTITFHIATMIGESLLFKIIQSAS